MQAVDKTQNSVPINGVTGENIASVGVNAPVTPTQPENGDVTLGFFVVGMVINIVMIIAYFLWAYKNWNNKNRQDKT